MKAEELKSNIWFESRDVGDNLTMITGTLEVCASMEYDRRAIEAYQNSDLALDEIKERIRESIMWLIYDDQRQELFDAVMELFKAAPTDYFAMHNAREKILHAAKRQGGSVPDTDPPPIRGVPPGCQEIPGYILEVFEGSAWITQDGLVTEKWQERGVWPTPEAAEEAKQRFFAQNSKPSAGGAMEV